MLYFRKFLDMLFTSIIPSIAAFLFMWRFMGYNTWLIGCIICTIIFFGGNALLIRRFARDMASKYDYYITWIPTYVVYTVLGTLCLINKWMYPFTWMFFHTRIFEIITMGLKTPIKPFASFIISMALYFALVMFAYPAFFKNYKSELMSKTEQYELERHRRHQKRIERYEKKMDEARELYEEAHADSQNPPTESESTVKSKHHHHYHDDNDQTLYTKKELMKMDKMQNMKAQGKKVLIKVDNKGGSIIISNIANFLFNVGSYSFYQMVKEKKSMGLDIKPIVRSYIRRKLTFGRKR